MLVALGAGQHRLEPLDKRLPLLRIGSAQKLLGFLPRPLEAMQSSADRLATEHQPEPLADPDDQAAQRPARRRVGASYGRGGCGTRCGVHDLAEAGLDPGAKGGRPPVRRKMSASGPWSL